MLIMGSINPTAAVAGRAGVERDALNLWTRSSRSGKQQIRWCMCVPQVCAMDMHCDMQVVTNRKHAMSNAAMGVLLQAIREQRQSEARVNV